MKSWPLLIVIIVLGILTIFTISLYFPNLFSSNTPVIQTEVIQVDGVKKYDPEVNKNVNVLPAAARAYCRQQGGKVVERLENNVTFEECVIQD